jgi:DNA-directed RNA polymerase specialized sigma24 family protein
VLNLQLWDTDDWLRSRRRSSHFQYIVRPRELLERGCVAEGLEEVHATLARQPARFRQFDEMASTGLSGRAIAKTVGVSEATVRRILRGSRTNATKAAPHAVAVPCV